MPEGSHGIVRAEFQGDRDTIDSSSTCFIMISRVDLAPHCDNYNSSGGSDSENDSTAWDRSPRSGHPRKRYHAHADQHGSQRGLQSVKTMQVQHKPQLPQVSTSVEKKKKYLSLPTKPKKQRKRSMSCNIDYFKSDSNRKKEEEEKQGAKCDFGKENGLEKGEVEDKKKECQFGMYIDNKQEKLECNDGEGEVTDNSGFKRFKDNKEFYDKGEEKLEMFNKLKTYITEEKFAEEDIVDFKMGKYEKDSVNAQRSLKIPPSRRIEKDQTDMFEKQKMKKEDARTFEKRDKEKEFNAEQRGTLDRKTEDQKQQQSEKANEKEKENGVEFVEGRNNKEEKLVVNMEQGRWRQKNRSTWSLEMDNKVVDALEKIDKEKKEQTILKEVLDPLVDSDSEMEKQDNDIKETSLGFEVDENCVEVEEPESTSNLQTADKLWHKRQRESERCISVDETSCIFFSMEDRSTQLQSYSLSTSYSCSLESEKLSDISHSCPGHYRVAVVQDSNLIRNDEDNIFRNAEAWSEHSKKRILETIDTLSGKEEYFEDSIEKFRKEEVDKSERTKDENDVNEDKIEAGEAYTSPENTDGDNNDDDGDSNTEEETIDTAEEIFADDIGQNNDQMNGNDEDPFEIIDAEEKDEVEKESIEVFSVKRTEVEEKEERPEKENVDVLELKTNRFEEKGESSEKGNVDVFELKTNDVEEVGKRAEIPDTTSIGRYPNMHKAQDATNMPPTKILTGNSVKGHSDNETRKTKCLRICPCNRTFKKENKADKRHERKKLPKKEPNIWMKMKKNPEVKLPKQKGTDMAPKKNCDGRRYSMFGCREFGRKCSSNNSGGGGSFEGNPNSSRNQRSNDDKDSRNRRNQDKKDRENEDKNNNNSGRNNPAAGAVTNPETTVHTEPTRGIVEVNTPAADFKRYRKKVTEAVFRRHRNIEDFGWLGKIAAEIVENNGPSVKLFEILEEGECRCVEERFNNPQELSKDAFQCSICITVDSLLKHYAHCTSAFNSCDMCVKIFSLLCSHVVACIRDNAVTMCEIRICKTIKIVAENNIAEHMKTLWFQVRKKLARILDDGEEDVIQQSTQVEEPKPRRTSKGLSFSGPLPSIPEGTPLSLTSTSRSGSRVLIRKKSSLANVEEQKQTVVSEEGSSEGAAEVEAAGAQGVGLIDEDDSCESVDSKYGLESASFSRPEIPDEADAIPTSSEEGSVESTGSGSTEGSGHFGVMTVASRFRSLPMGPPGQGEPYFPSFKDRPTGKKGIGEVVYANKHQLVVVVTIWEKFKIQYLIEAKLAKHYTEEGVILPEFKNKLRIKGLRYQNEFQWVKVAHLGNGMTGKCHLATDFETDFKFCVKEIHISNYEKEEIELWSELEHPYIVQVYGAIRHGEKIYILQEFIEGGCLTEAINVQRKLSRRLSQLTALRYFQQLLEVLKYLKSRNILHEDLKADNILLNKNGDSVTIKVADFGLARRCQGSVRSGTKPVGTQTQWSPEKAEARVGYGFAAEVWASVCVLVHMLSGQPPWMRRYESFKALIMVIVEKSPPIEDIPGNIHDSIKDLIKRGFTVCQGQRPAAENLLEHSAFRLLDEASALQSINNTYSILESLHFEAPTNQIDDDPNADLREICRNLERESAQSAAAKNGARRKDEKESVVDIHSEVVPYYSNEYRVYISESGGDGKANKNSQLSFGQETGYGNKRERDIKDSKNEAGSSSFVDIYTRSRLPSHPDTNVDPTKHIDRFYNDDAEQTIPPNNQPNLVIYHPSLESMGSQRGNSGSQHSSLEHLSSGTVTKRLLPDFGKIGMSNPGEDISDTGVEEVFDFGSIDEEKEEDVLKNFDFDKAVGHVGEQYTLPTVLNSSADMSPGLGVTSAQSSSIPIATERSNDMSNLENQEGYTAQTQSETTVTTYSGFGEDPIQSFNEDDLFKSGSPPGLVGIGLSQQFNTAPIPNNQSIPRSAPALFMQTNVGQYSFMHSNIKDAVPQSAQHRILSRTDQNEQGRRDPLLQHGYDPMQKYQSTKQQTGSQSRQQIEMQSMQQAAGTQSMQHYLPTPSRQYVEAQFRQQQMEAVSQQQLLMQQTRQQQTYLTQSHSCTNLYPPDNHNTYNHNRGQDQVHMFQYGQGYGHSQPRDINYQQGSSSTNYGNGFDYLQRSDMQPGEFVRSEGLGQSDNRIPHDNISMPNQTGRPYAAPFHPLSLAPNTQFNPYQTSTQHHNGARPKVPQIQRQLFPSSESPQYMYRRDTDVRINDPRKAYEESLVGATSRPYTGYPAQPRTPLLNPVINPRPPLPQEGQRAELRLDINRAQLGTDMPVLSHAQTAPVFSPPKTPSNMSKKSPDFHRTLSQVPLPVRKSPSLTGIRSSSPSQREDKMSTSTSRSQFEEQDEAFRELSRTAEEALSQHSDHAAGIFTFNDDDDDDDFDDEIKAEIDDRYLDNPAESLAHVLDPVQDTSMFVVFRSKANGKEFKMNFFPKHASLTWEKIIKEELDGFSRVAMSSEYGLQRFCLRRLDGSVVDLDSCLGNSSCTLIMTEATDSDPWWIEGGMIAK